jgi:hypothetical protein
MFISPYFLVQIKHFIDVVYRLPPTPVGQYFPLYSRDSYVEAQHVPAEAGKDKKQKKKKKEEDGGYREDYYEDGSYNEDYYTYTDPTHLDQPPDITGTAATSQQRSSSV